MDEDMPVTFLSQIVEVLEEHTRVLQAYRQAFEDIYRQLAELTKSVEKLKTDDSLNSSDSKFLLDITERMKAIITTFEAKKYNLATRSKRKSAVSTQHVNTT